MTIRKDNNRVTLKKGETQRPNGTYCYRWADERGDRHAIYAKTLKELREKEKDREKHLRKRVTVDNLYYEWLECRRDLKDTTVVLYNKCYQLWIKPVIGKYHLDDVRKNDVKIMLNNMIGRNLSKTRIQTTLSIVVQMLDYAVDYEYIDTNVAKGCGLLLIKGIERPEKRTGLTADEQKRFFAFLEEKYPQWFPLFTFLVNTGLRINEALALKWSNLDVEHNIVHVTGSLKYINGHFSIDKPKTKSSVRAVFVSDELIDLIVTTRKQNTDDGYIFCTKKGTPLFNTNLNDLLRDIVADYNATHEDTMRHISCHTFRHTYATRLMEAGVHVKAIQRLMGHAKLDITMNTYTDSNDDFIQRELQKLKPKDAEN